MKNEMRLLLIFLEGGLGGEGGCFLVQLLGKMLA